MPTQRKNLKKYYSDLKKKITVYSDQYYTHDSPTITDQEFDILYNELLSIEKEHPEYVTKDSPSQRIGAKVLDGFKKIKHDKPMMSLSNASNEREFLDFYNKTIEEYAKGGLEFFAEPKFDGLAISLTYISGNFHSAVTRGDGDVGEDVTSNVRTIKSLPMTLKGSKYPKKLVVTAEIFSLIADFKQINSNLQENDEKTFANPRNFAAGTIRQLNPLVAFKRNLQIYIHGLIDIDDAYTDSTHSESLKRLQKFGFNICNTNKIIKNSKAAIEYFNLMSDKRATLPYEIDGIVYKINDLQLRETVGYTSKAPKWSIAYKFTSLQSETQLVDVKFQVGRTGTITPVAELKPVRIGGVKVSRASLHNMDEIVKKDIQINDYVFVKRAGDVIPEIDRVNKNKRNNTKIVKMPSKCPSCGGIITKISDQSIFRCSNELKCKPQIIQSISHFVSRKAMNIIGLGENIISALIDAKKINNYSDLFYLQKKDVLEMERMAELSVMNLLNSIDKSKNPDFDKFIYSLGIREVGSATARILASKYKNISFLVDAELDELTMIKDIGPIVAKNIVDYFNNNANRDKIDRLILSGVEINYKKTIFNDAISEKLFVITGSFSIKPRKEIEEIIVSLGGKVSGAISKNTDFLICGDKPGSKLAKAKREDIKIISEKEFFKLL